MLDPRRFQHTQQTSFGQRHLKFWSNHPLLLWPVSRMSVLYYIRLICLLFFSKLIKIGMINFGFKL